MCYALKSTQNSDTLSEAYSLFVKQCDQETSKILKGNLIYLSILDHDRRTTRAAHLNFE